MAKKHPFDPEKAHTSSQETESSPRLFKRLLDSSLNILVSGDEDGERSLINPKALTREVLSQALGQLDRGKVEIVSLFGREFKRFLEATDLSEEIMKVLNGITVELKAEVSFKKMIDGELPKAEVKITEKKTPKKRGTSAKTKKKS